MKWRDLVDIWPRGKTAPAQWMEPALYTRVLSDFDEAPVGVLSLALPSRDYAPVIEKHLRDAGITETVSTVIAHDVRRGGELARVFFTAVAAAGRIRRHCWGKSGQQLFVFPVAALLARVATVSADLGAVVLVKDEAALVLVAAAGEVRVAEWLALGASAEEDARRVADFLRRDLGAQIDEHSAPQKRLGVSLFHAGGAAAQGATATDDSAAARTAYRLAQLLAAMALPAQAGSCVPTVRPAQTLLADARLSDALSARGDRLAFLAERAVPWVVALMGVLLAAALWSMVAAATQLGADEQALSALNGSVSSEERGEIERLSALASARAEHNTQLQHLLSLRARAARMPDLRRVLSDIKLATPDTVRISEVGVATDDERSMVFVTGSTQWSEQVLVDEQKLVAELEARGYLIEQRDLFSAAGSSGFKLALTWGMK